MVSGVVWPLSKGTKNIEVNVAVVARLEYFYMQTATTASSDTNQRALGRKATKPRSGTRGALQQMAAIFLQWAAIYLRWCQAT